MLEIIIMMVLLIIIIIRALTNTVGGEYECIHDYRVTNTNAKHS